MGKVALDDDKILQLLNQLEKVENRLRVVVHNQYINVTTGNSATHVALARGDEPFNHLDYHIPNTLDGFLWNPPRDVLNCGHPTNAVGVTRMDRPVASSLSVLLSSSNTGFLLRQSNAALCAVTNSMKLSEAL